VHGGAGTARPETMVGGLVHDDGGAIHISMTRGAPMERGIHVAEQRV
jgi:hypothetical protein